MGFDPYDKTPPIATCQARAVIIVKTIQARRYYANGMGGWTTSPELAFKYHNFRTALIDGQSLGAGCQVTLTRKFHND